MDFEIKVTTPGSYLSTRSLFGVISDLNRAFEIGTVAALKSEFPHASNTFLKKRVRGKLDFNIIDARKGSWEIALIGATGGIIGKVIYDLFIDIVKTSEKWKKFKERISTPSERAAKCIASELENKEKLGPFIIEKRSLQFEKNEHGTMKLKYDVTLLKSREIASLLSTEEQVADFLKQLEDGKE